MITVSQLLSQAWSTYKHKFVLFAGIMALPTAADILMYYLYNQKDVIDTSLTSSVLINGNNIILSLAVLLGAIVIYLWSSVALLYAVIQRESNVEIIESYKKGWNKVIPYLSVSILVGLCTLVGLVLLIVPGIIVAVWFSMSLFVMMVEDRRGMDALHRSKAYVKGRWGSVFGREIAILLISMIITVLVSLIFKIINIPFKQEITQIINNLLLTPLALVYMFSLYENLKATHVEAPENLPASV